MSQIHRTRTLVCGILVGAAVIVRAADYSRIPTPVYSDVADGNGVEVMLAQTNGVVRSGKFKVGRVMDEKVFGQMNWANEKFVRAAAQATLAITGEMMQVTFVCPIPKGVALQTPNTPWWGDRVAFCTRRSADDPTVRWFVAGAGGVNEKGLFFLKGGQDKTWKSDARISVTTNAAAYRVAMTIPLRDAFGKMPKPGDVFGVSFKRLGPTAGGSSAWAINGSAFNTERDAFGVLVFGGSGPYFRRRLAEDECRAEALATDADAKAAVTRLLRPLQRAVAESGDDPAAFGPLECMFAALERSLVAVVQKGDALLLFEPENAWGNAIEPTLASRPLENLEFRIARNTRAVRAFALANLGGAPFVGCLKASDRDWWNFQNQNSDGLCKRDGILRHTRIRRGVPIYSRERRVLYDPLVDLPVGSLVEVSVGATVPLYLELDTHGLAAGVYGGWLRLQSCAPGFRDRKIPIKVTVTNDDLDTIDNPRLAYTDFMETCFPQHEPVTNAVRELVRRGYNTILLTRLDFYPYRDANGVWHEAAYEITDRYIDLWLAAGLDPKKMRLQPFIAVERERDRWWGLRDQNKVRIPFGTPEYDEGFRFMIRALTRHFQSRYGVGTDRIFWYPVDEAGGVFPDPTLKSSASRNVHAARLIKEVDRANLVFSDPIWMFLQSPGFLANRRAFVENIDILVPSRPQLTAETVEILKALPLKALACYHVSERENTPDNYRLYAWQNMRDGMRPEVNYWHNDECSGFSFKAEHAYASMYVDQDLDLISLSRRQLAADMAYEEGRLVDYLKGKYRDDPARFRRIDELVRAGADGHTMKAMDRALNGLSELLPRQ